MKRILVLNAGSSSLKFATFTAGAEPVLEAKGQVAGIGQGATKLDVADAADARLDWGGAAALASHEDALAFILEKLNVKARPQDWLGIGHRVVHGGAQFAAPVRIDDTALRALAKLIPLAPLHQPHNVAPIESLRRLMPDLPQVACFDTAFHMTQPEVAVRFPLPDEYWQKGLRRYGFHGLSYEAILHALPKVAGTGPSRMVIAHLGNGASMAAVRNGTCIATTMGFSTLDGLMMGTRGGALDPGLLLHLLREGMSREELERLLYHGSGLLGVSGISADMKTLLASADPKAKLAIEIYCYRIGRELGSLAAALGGMDALVFTGGVGENAAPIRAKVCDGAAWLGLDFDAAANAAGASMISRRGSRLSAWVVPTNEELTIARHTRALLA